MTPIRTTHRYPTCAALVALLAAAGLPAAAATVNVNLTADVTTNALPPNNEMITMWAFGLDTNGVTVPGPEIRVTEGDTLIIHLTNNLSAEPVSIVIPGQLASMTPTTFMDGQGRTRVRSFTHEAAPGATADYTWTSLKAGTYLYHSGTHPQVQVQMGLYGTLVVEPTTAGQAYGDVSSAFDAELTLLFSEIDPALHAAVASGNYGPTGTMTSTVDYLPRYFLINGEPWSPSTPTIAAGAAGDRVLIRFLNAGLETHAPAILNTHWQVIAEDGNLYVQPRMQCSLSLPAGQTKDVIFQPSSAATLPIYDRRLDTSNAGLEAGGMLRILEVAP